MTLRTPAQKRRTATRRDQPVPDAQPTHSDLANAIAAINARLDQIDEKLTPISELYTAGKVGGTIFKWVLGVLVSIAGLAAVLWPTR